MHATPQEFQARGFTMKTRQMFTVDNTPKKFKKKIIITMQQLPVILGLCMKKNSVREIAWLSLRHPFQRKFVFKMFSVH